MIKLKNILKEAAWDRTAGKTLPTLEDVQKAYEADNFDSRLKKVMGDDAFNKAVNPPSEWPTWQVVFDDGNINGVEYSSSRSYRTKARTTVEAIKKATKLAGGDVQRGDWMAVDILKLKKL